jgi:hypothetical protein
VSTDNWYSFLFRAVFLEVVRTDARQMLALGGLELI